MALPSTDSFERRDIHLVEDVVLRTPHTFSIPTYLTILEWIPDRSAATGSTLRFPVSLCKLTDRVAWLQYTLSHMGFLVPTLPRTQFDATIARHALLSVQSEQNFIPS